MQRIGTKFGRCEEHARAVLKDKGVTEPSQQQINQTLDKLEEHHAIMFVYKADQQKYGKFLEQMENNLPSTTQRPLSKTIVDACRVLAGWKNKYGARDNKVTDAKDGVAFATTSGEEDNKQNKKKEITCYKCKKTGHYSNECDMEETVKTSNKIGSYFLVKKKIPMYTMKSITTTTYM